MKSPCVAACKNNAGMCSGCYRTINEIIGWKDKTEEERSEVMNKLSGEKRTHACAKCGSPTYCEISAGGNHCWCFEIEKRDTSTLNKTGTCLCRKCLSELPLE
ncbi:DUF1289 domain-containing protein [Vibrio nigripulchritudo]|uniref:DUF1289 domain-containing protein n=1 Tax=Vibrio nigripulchritudo TaxID=28173 RepID=UPI0005F9BBDA|nr:DUF1289 domain-containing protein [Vibrio nigripulchritudo]KJY75282.1 hypothetical protein TW74_18115 [Vibrio nigripulchritudo]